MYFRESHVTDLLDLRQCDRCDCKTAFITKTQILVPPRNLLITLKKYGMGISKSKVLYPFELNLSDYSANQRNLKYSLYSLVAHVGLNNFGHYKCYSKNHLDGKWYCYNDSNIVEVPEYKVAKINAYIGFYELYEAEYSFIPK